MNQNEIIEKIKKCLRLARKAGTDGEKVAAELAAKRMADANGIALESVNADAENAAKAVVQDGTNVYKRRGVEIGYICTILKEHFGVIVIINLVKGGKSMRLTFVGCRLNIEVAKYVFDILWRESDRAWNSAKKERVAKLEETARMAGIIVPRGYRMKTNMKKHTFMQGWFTGIDKTLRENPIRNDVEQFEAEKAEMERRYQQFKSEAAGGVKERRQEAKVSQDEKNAFYRAFLEGRKVHLNRPCEGTATPSPFALGHTAQLKGGL